MPYPVRLFNRLLLIAFVLFFFFRCVLPNPKQNSEPTPQKLPEAPDAPIIASFTKEALSSNDTTTDNSLQPLSDSTHILSQKNVFLAKKTDYYLRVYKPDHAIILVVDANSNEIISWGQRSEQEIQNTPYYLSQSTFPAASLAKTITLAAALESQKFFLDSPIPLIGRAHTLYKYQLQLPQNAETNNISLQEAYARSYNPPFGIVGIQLGAKHLSAAASKLGFNTSYPSNIPENSNYYAPESDFETAEVASGFTKKTTLSPLLAAAQIRAILKKDALKIPTAENLLPYAPIQSEEIKDSKFEEKTYEGLQNAMMHTISNGTAQKNFSTRFLAKRFKERLDLGGKTGSLDGLEPKGRYEWFAGFAHDPLTDEGIVLVIMQVHQDIRTQAATQIASLLINIWAKEFLE